MSIRTADHTARVEQIADQIAVALRHKYPHITTEIIYNPPDGASAWVQVGATHDADEWREITDSTLDLTVAALERDGILVLAI